MQVDLMIEGAWVYQTPTRSFEKKNVAIKGDKFYYLSNEAMQCESTITIQAENQYMIPGLLDIHMHIESSMTTPSLFSQSVLPFGVTTVVADGHEIANVFGLEGLEAFMQAKTKLDIFHAIPSSVPSTRPDLETTGGIIGLKEVERLLENPKVICLGEAMNFRGIAYEPDSLIRQIIDLCIEKRPTMALEGHIPTIYGQELADFLYSGISSDHTHQFPEYLLEKIQAGLFIQFQSKSITSENMKVIKENHLYDFACLITDDVMADDLLNGHLNENLKKAVRAGLPINEAIYMTTYTPARRMSLHDRGIIAPGKKADFLLLDNLEEFLISSVYKSGKKVEVETDGVELEQFPKHFYQSVQCRKLTKEDLVIKVDTMATSVKCNVIQKHEMGTFTKRIIKEIPIVNGQLDYQAANCSLLIVMERYGKNGNIAYALVDNALTEKGAIATTWAHDHHNLMVMGNDTTSILVAQQAILDMQGGYVAVESGEVIAQCPLTIGGILSQEPIETLGRKLGEVRLAMRKLGYKNFNEIMSFSTLSLPVSPEIKITDFGMMNTKTQKFYPLICEEQ